MQTHRMKSESEMSSDALISYMKFQEPLRSMMDCKIDVVRYLLPRDDVTGDDLVKQVRDAGNEITSGVDAAVEAWRVEKEPHTYDLS